MAGFASIGGVRIVAGSIAIPLYGAWSGDLSLASAEPNPGTQVDFVFGNLTLKGAVFRTAPFAGGRTCRVVGGANGWKNTIRIGPYRQAGGVRRATVFGDAARACGESFADTENPILGPYWITESCPGSRVLRQLFGNRWHIDNAGVTRPGGRTPTRIRSSFSIVKYDGGRGVIEIATEDPGSWMPGNTFTSPLLSSTLSIGGMLLTFNTEGHARIEVLTNGA